MTGVDYRARDAVERVVGTVPFVLHHKAPSMVHAKIVRSTFPHARVLAIDTDAALAHEGVLAVLTGAQLQSDPLVEPYFGEWRQDQPILAIDKVRYVGDAVALVVAETPAEATAAALDVSVTYEELPYTQSSREAQSEGAPAVHDEYPDNACGWGKLRFGNIEAGFADSDVIVEGTYSTPRGSHVPMEPHVTVADWQHNQIEVWTATQTPYAVRRDLARIFGLSESEVRVRVLNLGGGFGAKGQTKIEPLAAVASRAVGRPVRLELSREEVFLTIGKHAAEVTIRTGAKHDGTLVARYIDIMWTAGAYAVTTPVGVVHGMIRSSGPYRIPNVWVDSRAFYTNTVPVGPFRGAMTTQVAWACESHMDELAWQLGLDPLEFRRRNLLHDGDTHPTGESMVECHYVELLEEAASGIGWDEESRHDSSQSVRGRGLSVVAKSTATPSRSEVRVVLNDDGTIIIYASSVEMGQGATSTLTQVLAHHLDVDPEQISIVPPDTSSTPFDTSTSSSRTTFSMGIALREASVELKRKLSELASTLLEIHPDDLVHAQGAVAVQGDSGVLVPYGDLLRDSGLSHLDAEGLFHSESTFDPDTGQGHHTAQWQQGAAGVEVEVDLETGKVEVLRCHGVAWAGRAVSPFRVRQQIQSCAIWGSSGALMEELIYDGGQLTNPNLSDYMIPSIIDIPAVLTTRALESAAPGAEVFGLGEIVATAIAPAVANAVFMATGVRIYDLPITPEKVLRGIIAKSRGA